MEYLFSAMESAADAQVLNRATNTPNIVQSRTLLVLAVNILTLLFCCMVKSNYLSENLIDPERPISESVLARGVDVPAADHRGNGPPLRDECGSR
jgi:hypothetical protein